jgi:hypothetical protein
MTETGVTWLGLTLEEIDEQIVERFQYPAFAAREASENIAALDERLRNDFSAFWRTGVAASSIRINGFDVDVLSQKKIKPLGIMLGLDWLLKEPDAAAKAFQRGRHTIA